MAKKNQDTIAGNTINNCSVLAAFGNCNVGKTKLNDVYDYFAKQVKRCSCSWNAFVGICETSFG